MNLWENTNMNCCCMMCKEWVKKCKVALNQVRAKDMDRLFAKQSTKISPAITFFFFLFRI
ncbi:TPA: hypothetical protein JBL19_15300 [Legionella pneumophila]|nr:hypothetical protein [Legionella pneumophila]HAT8356938.1 hypothetical protein [Legionella pneumophila]HAT8720193.1 hypothetical protein [Legionella pneumophila]HAU1191027.1 hypothetical protein [Legionella pneumophila]HAU1196039.1 hypothetical protein [Legionella pneumophila]